MTFRFTLSHSVLGSQVISEPDGWEGATLSLERDMDLFSLIETFSGGANDAFIFYGDNGTENGGIDFIRQVESTYGFDADITFLIEYAPDDVTYSTLFTGLLDLSAKNEMKDNRMQVPVVRDDFWTKFINRFETPVNLSDTVDLDGTAVAPVGPVFVSLSSQALRKTHYSYEPDKGISVTDVQDNEYIQFTPGQFDIDEMEDFYNLTPINNTEIPVSSFDVSEEGTYVFDIRWTISNIAGSTENHANGLTVYIRVNNETAEVFTSADFTSGGVDYTEFTYSGTLYLLAGDAVRIYCQQAGTSQTLNWGFWGTNGLLSGPFDAPTYDKPRPAAMNEVPTYTRVTADTFSPATEAPGYLIHDLIHGVLVRMGLGADPFYSEFLGGLLTQTKQYADDGCGWMYAVVKGLQLRQYTLTEKPFFISFKEIWEGINPILNLGLGYEDVDGSQVIRIEQKSHFIPSGATPPVFFDNVRELSASYDKDFIFKTIRVGYKQGKPEDISGIDDPYKQVRATRIQKSGTDINLESGFIASGLSIEITRRKKREKSADYKFDDNNFIIALNTNDVSPDVYAPELDENFDSVSGILNSSSRYNLILAPLRNFLRWATYFGGCLQSYLTSSYKFVSGEGNYDLTTDYSCASGNECQAIICDSLSESDDIPLTPYDTNFGHYFLPLLFDIVIPMSKEDYDLIGRKLPIGISQSTTGHVNFVIKSLKFDLINGEAKIQAWPEDTFNIIVPEQTIADPPCVTVSTPVVYDADYQAVLDYADLQGWSTPSTDQKAIENQKLIDMKADGVWDDLDLFYYSETDGDNNYKRINWKSPGDFTLTAHGSLTYGTDGITGDGSTGYLDTGWNPDADGVNFTLDEAGAFIKINNECTAGNLYQFGVDQASTDTTALAAKYSGSVHRFGINSSTVSVGSAVSSIGLFHTRRVADNDLRLFKDGSQVGSASTQASSVKSGNGRTLVLLAFNANGVIAGHSNAQIGCFGIGASMTGKESAINTIFG